MAIITYDAGSSSEGTPATSPMTWNHTCSGNDRLLMMGLVHFGGDLVTGVTYAGGSMTQLVKTSSFGGAVAYIYGITAPTVGVNSIAVTFSGGTAFVRAAAGSYNGVKRAGLPDATAHTENTTAAQTSIAGTVTTVTNNAWVGVFSYAVGSAFTSITNGTIRTTTDSGLAVWGDTNSPVTPAGNKTLTANFGSGAQQAILLAAFAPNVGGGMFLSNFV